MVNVQEAVSVQEQQPVVGQPGVGHDDNEQNRSLEANDECPEADAEADDDAIPSLKPGLESQPFLSIANCMNRSTGTTSTACNFNTHV